MSALQTSWTGLRARIVGRHLLAPDRAQRDATLLERALDGLRDDEVVLDIGAGNGFLTLALARQLPGGRVYALDLSTEMLQELGDRAEEQGLQRRIQVLLADAQAVGLDDGCVDRVVCSMLLHEVPAPAQVIAEMARVLRPGGRVVIKDLRDGLAGRAMVRVFHRGEGTRPLGVAELQGLLADAGLEQVCVEPSGIHLLATARVPA